MRDITDVIIAVMVEAGMQVILQALQKSCISLIKPRGDTSQVYSLTVFEGASEEHFVARFVYFFNV